MKKLIKFEYLFALALLLVLSVAMFVFHGDNQLVNIIAGTLVSSFGSITAFFFTKYNGDNNDDK